MSQSRISFCIGMSEEKITKFEPTIYASSDRTQNSNDTSSNRPKHPTPRQRVIIPRHRHLTVSLSRSQTQTSSTPDIRLNGERELADFSVLGGFAREPHARTFYSPRSQLCVCVFLLAERRSDRLVSCCSVKCSGGALLELSPIPAVHEVGEEFVRDVIVFFFVLCSKKKNCVAFCAR